MCISGTVFVVALQQLVQPSDDILPLRCANSSWGTSFSGVFRGLCWSLLFQHIFWNLNNWISFACHTRNGDALTSLIFAIRIIGPFDSENISFAAISTNMSGRVEIGPVTEGFLHCETISSWPFGMLCTALNTLGSLSGTFCELMKGLGRMCYGRSLTKQSFRNSWRRSDQEAVRPT